MDKRRRAPGALILLLASALLLPGRPPTARAEGEGGDAGYRSATACQECHPEIYRTWRGSQHASAFTDPAFQLPYDRIRRENPRAVLPCERCHNPMRDLLPPGDSMASIFGREGVTCDFCHSVDSVEIREGLPRYRGQAGITFGPRGGEGGKSVHRTRFSSFHVTSDLCAGCHEFRNAFGLPILSTYSEWKESFYRGEEIHCQFCHLPELFGARFIDGKKKRKGPVDHAMVGGHSRERLAKAIRVRASLTVTGGEARLAITLRNETVGHRIPTGIPTHRLVLTSTLYDAEGNVLGTKEEAFEKVVGDGKGNAVERPELIFTAAREILRDNRLGPKENREIVHSFPSKGARPASAEVVLVYQMPPPYLAPELRSIDVPVSRIVVPARRAVAGAAAAALVALAAVLALAAFMFLWRRRRASLT